MGRKPVIKSFIFVFFVLFLVYSEALAEDNIPSLNELPLNLEEEIEEYSILLAGHIYGKPSKKSVFPSASMLGNIQLFNSIKPRFMVLLGDLVKKSNENQISILNKTFLSKLESPVFNAPGNHDLANRELYVKHFGKTYSCFQYLASMFVLLDSEIDNGDIKGEQFQLLIDRIEYCKRTPGIKNIFIFSHRLIWAIDNPAFSRIISFVNGYNAHKGRSGNIIKTVIPKLKALAGKNVYFISGDIGCDWAMTVFYEKKPDSNIAYIATGIGDSERDAILKVNIKKNSDVDFIPVSLTGQEMLPIENYGIDYWENHFNRMHKDKPALFTRAFSVLTSKRFWAGVILSAILFGAAFFVVSRKKRGTNAV